MIRIVVGLFIWIALPSLLRKSTKNKMLKKFYLFSCTIIGSILVLYGAINVVKDLFYL